jgi:hypothetical protein
MIGLLLLSLSWVSLASIGIIIINQLIRRQHQNVSAALWAKDMLASDRARDKIRVYRVARLGAIFFFVAGVASAVNRWPGMELPFAVMIVTVPLILAGFSLFVFSYYLDYATGEQRRGQEIERFRRERRERTQREEESGHRPS